MVTGDVRSGTNLAATVMGQYMGRQFMGYAIFNGAYSGTAILQPVSGTLSGAVRSRYKAAVLSPALSEALTHGSVFALGQRAALLRSPGGTKSRLAEK